MSKLQDRINRIKVANDWLDLINCKLSDETERCISNTIIYPPVITPSADFSHPVDTDFMVVETTTVDAIFKFNNPDEKMTVLNFASYKNPGGGYTEGSLAQEESLCAASNLYPILKAFKDDYYADNAKNVNRSLYRNNLLYTPGVSFFDTTKYNNSRAIQNAPVLCDVITCAAPNAKAAKKQHKVSQVEINSAMAERCMRILYVAHENKTDVLVLGAFGCGVFGNNPTDVARIFGLLLVNGVFMDCFKKVIFAIPRSPLNNNARVFNTVFTKRLKKRR